MALLIGIVLFVVIDSVPAGVGTGSVLVLGGNGLLGSATVDRLLARGQWKVTVTSRGSWYWSEGFDTRVRQIVCDRYADGTLEKSCPQLHTTLLEEKFDFILDFTAYNEQGMDKITYLLRDFRGVYVYISSDSVYEVCERKHSGNSVESDAPCETDDNQFHQLLRDADGYGYGKLQAENVLTSSGLDYVILRLPDVIGPRDSLHRLWTYLIWMQVAKRLNTPLQLPVFFLNRPMSVVYSLDVAELVEQILHAENHTIINDVYNVACDETITLYRLLRLSRQYQHQDSGANDDVVYLVDPSSGYYLFPSVTLGPINTDKAKLKLRWKPTTLSEAVKVTVDFHEQVMRNQENKAYKWNKDRVIARMVRGPTPFRDQEEQLRAAIDEIYTNARDEL